ncbi:MAG: hypothetical protein AAGH78_00615 [Cyanobacteria bacterium P01_H01_bin.58]
MDTSSTIILRRKAGDTERLSVTVPADVSRQIKENAKSDRTSISEAICQALELDLYIQEEISNGSRLFIQKSNGEVVEIKFQ